jgi:hypothetical protein
MGTKTGLNGITFGDATVQNTAAVTGVSSAVAGSGISVSGATGAVTFTNSGVTSIVAGSGISISGGTGAVTVTASGGGTVTSVATGNGLSGGTITSSGTLVVAAPAWNSVGSYVFGGLRRDGTASTSYDTNVSAGSGNGQLQASQSALHDFSCYGRLHKFGETNYNVLSGTWKTLNGTTGGTVYGTSILMCLAVRVS